MSQALNEFLASLHSRKPADALGALESYSRRGNDDSLAAMLRTAAFFPGQPASYYYRVRTAWQQSQRIPLKPNSHEQPVLLLTDFTANDLLPLVELFSAAMGVRSSIRTSSFDSVEQEILNLDSTLETGSPDVIVLLLSERWLQRYLQDTATVSEDRLDEVKCVLADLVSAIRSKEPARILIGNFPGRSYPLPGASLSHGKKVGWNLALAGLNAWLAQLVDSKVHIIDTAEAISGAGGRSALAGTGYLRARMAFETSGSVAVAREIAMAIAHVCGKGHRALVTDWDNTIWGGEVGELGSHGVECGFDSPDGLGYRFVQEYMKGLTTLGIVLCAATRNDPRVARVLDDNHDLILSSEDFAALNVSWEPKSLAIEATSKAVGFGSEFMLFLDDSLFEIGEVLAQHPYIDVLLAGPAPDQTLERLAASRMFATLTLSDDDVQRNQRVKVSSLQGELRGRCGSLEEYLQGLAIRVTVSPLHSQNEPRVVQLLQKSNQFNLTTRRYRESDLRRLSGAGARIGVFAYEDCFGPQGIIAVVILVEEGEIIRIDSWVMSCRVLNRTVEDGVFEWIRGCAGGRSIVGEYIPTDRNGLVSHLLEGLGFERSDDRSSKCSQWEYKEPLDDAPRPHFVKLQSVEEVSQ